MSLPRHVRDRHVVTATALFVLASVMSACVSSVATDPGAALPRPEATGVPSDPTSMIALDGDDVVELDPETGQVIRRHVIEEPGAGIEDLELVTSRQTVLVGRRTAAGHTEVVEVSRRDGTTRILAEGAVPAVTADGARVAFSRRTGEQDQLQLVVTGYDGPELAAWPAHEAGHEHLSLTSLGWDPSGRRLVFTLQSALGTEVRVLPVDRDGTVRGASEVIDPTSANAELTAATFRSPRVVTVAERCCGQDDDARWRVLDIDLVTGSPKELTAGLEHAVTHLDWSPDQQRLAITLDEEPPSVMSWHDGDLEPLADQSTAAEW